MARSTLKTKTKGTNNAHQPFLLLDFDAVTLGYQCVCVCVCVCVAARKHVEVMYTEYLNIFAYAHTHTYIYNYTWYMDHLCIYLLIFRPSVCTFIMEKVPLRWARHRGSMHQCFHGSRTASVARCFLMGIESVISWGNHGSIGKP